MIVLAGPSGAGKSRLADRLALPVLRLDDFYHEVTAANLPRIDSGANRGLVDWDDPRSWDRDAAMASVRQLCVQGRSEVPLYDISTSSRTGSHVLDLAGHTHFVAEGIFAPEVVAQCTDEGLLEAAYCITQHPLLTFWRRLARDLRERRKPPLVLVRRGVALLRDHRRVVRHAVASRCRPVSPEQAWRELTSELGGAR